MRGDRVVTGSARAGRAAALAAVVAACAAAGLASRSDAHPLAKGSAGSSTAQLTVDAKSNIYGAGASVAPAPGGGGGGILPRSIAVRAGSVVRFTSVKGIVGCCGTDPGNTADGGGGSTAINAFGGISGISVAAQMFLAGVFLSGAAPAAPAPPTFTGRLDFAQRAPKLAQVFFIGDGLTGKGAGAVQRFVAPAGATRLFLGFADGFAFHGDPGWYQDDHGKLTVTVQVGGGAAGGPPTGTATGTVTVNGQPFTSGPIPYGSTVDVTGGRLTLRADVGTLTVYGDGTHPALFAPSRKFERVKGKRRALVQLTLVGGDFSTCTTPLRTTSGRSQKPKKTVRALWGKGKGRFRTQGRYASATVRGTFWLTADRCDGTLVTVRQGVVQVNDRTRRRKVTVRAGRSYLAPAPGAAR